jgi:hypothetical protein
MSRLRRTHQLYHQQAAGSQHSFLTLFSFGWKRFALASFIVVIAIGGFMLVDRQTKLSANAILEEAEIKKK